MAMRRTKEASAGTRQQILAAARIRFVERGVARTTLDEIAKAAGVTRGAIYWHFEDKHALFNAMREQVSLPMADRTDFALVKSSDNDPLAAVELFLLGLLESMRLDPAARSTLEIMQLKCEYVDEFAGEIQRLTGRCRELQRQLVEVYERARTTGQLRDGVDPALAALETCVFATGLLRLWLIDGTGSLIRRKARALIHAHVESRRSPVAAPERRRENTHA